ncbi:MAG: Maf family protein [Elusimicrobiota bacterium]|jgi:septum formation protein|nr:Maf family protein [Elusimicrobiota bacterium]
MKKQIILASASPRRISLLKEMGITFKIIPSRIKEDTHFVKPSYIVRDLAYRKGISVSQSYPNSIVLSADTIVVLNKKIIGKPQNMKESQEIIRKLNGSLHKVYTGVFVKDNVSNKQICFYDCANVKMKKLSEQELGKFFGENMDKAGGYAVQDTNDSFVDRVYGDYYTVVGLPIKKLKKELKRFNIRF